MNKQNTINEMVARLFSDGELAERELEEICRHLTDASSADSRDEALLEYFASCPGSDTFPEPPDRADAMAAARWRYIANSLAIDADLEGLTHRYYHFSRIRRLQWRRAVRTAAAVALPIALGVGIIYLGNERHRSSMHTAASSHRTVSTVTFDHQVSADSVRVVILADGTEVTLNDGALLSYNDNREAGLRGEAYFEVAPNTKRPFIIHSDHLTARVLGTEFIFNSGTSASSLSLYEGVVELSSDSEVRTLDDAGTQFTIDHATDRSQIGAFDASHRPDWAAESSLDIVPLGEILNRIESAYGVRFVGRDRVDLSRRYNFIFDPATPLPKVMASLAFLNNDLEYTIDGTKIVLIP